MPQDKHLIHKSGTDYQDPKCQADIGNVMKKTILFRLFKIGAIPKKLLPVLESEGIVILDEGVGGWYITKNVKGPCRRHIHRSEGFSGCLVVTKKRIICYAYWKRQINISVEDPRISELYISLPEPNVLSISFESGLFRDGWKGVIEFRFKTEKAVQFYDILISIGTRKGSAADAIEPHV